MNKLKQSPVWVNWKRDPERGKIPINPVTGGSAMSNNPHTWTNFITAERESSKYSGLGFMFHNGLCGIDIDGTDGHTKNNPLALEVLELFKGTYTELSPSGKGYHILFYCDLSKIPTITDDKGNTKLDPLYYQKNPKNGLECYLSGLTKRYFTYTGLPLSNEIKINDMTEQVRYFLEKYMYRGGERLSESTLNILRNGKNSSKFIALHDMGDKSAYNNDDSSADLALCNMLVWALQGDFNAVDTAFRGSALYRQKWERADYREQTINKAISLCGGEYYKGRGRPKGDGKKKIKHSEYLTPENLAAYLKENDISVRYNEITKALDIEGMSEESREHLSANITALTYSKLQGQYKNCSMHNVSAFLDIIASRERYNPVLDLLSTHTYNGKDYLSELYEILSIKDDDVLSKTLIKKWLWQCISLLYNDPALPFGADGVLVLTGEQGIGKTSIFRKLALSPLFFKEGVCVDFRDKDSYIRALSCWIAELGEIETTFKSDVERLKAFITQTVDEYRKAYSRGDIKGVRRTSMCGTCNSNQFLIDTSGNRRFWTVPIEKINLKSLSAFNTIQLWKQIEQLQKTDLHGFRLTADEQAQLQERNALHEKKLKGEDEIEDILNTSSCNTFTVITEEMTVTQFKDINSDTLRSYSVAQIGKVLDKLGYAVEVKKVNGKTQKLRQLPKKTYNC